MIIIFLFFFVDSTHLLDLVKQRAMLTVAYQKEHYKSKVAGCQTKLAQLGQQSSLSQTRTLTTLSASNVSDSIRKFVEEKARLCQPEQIKLCDGSETENQQLINLMVKEGILEKLPKYENW